jgi:hypothetical protein
MGFIGLYLGPDCQNAIGLPRCDAVGIALCSQGTPIVSARIGCLCPSLMVAKPCPIGTVFPWSAGTAIHLARSHHANSIPSELWFASFKTSKTLRTRRPDLQQMTASREHAAAPDVGAAAERSERLCRTCNAAWEVCGEGRGPERGGPRLIQKARSSSG